MGHHEVPSAATGTSLTTADVVRRVSEAAFGRPLVTNVLRGQVAEAIVAAALEPAWTWCSADYASWDFERGDGVRLEVKQSAARQSWATQPGTKPSAPSFDVAPRTGWWSNGRWIAEAGRAADIYVLAFHGVADDEADHRDPFQWRFFVLRAAELPDTKRIGLARVSRATDAVHFDGLRDAVTRVAAELTPRWVRNGQRQEVDDLA